MLGLTFKNYHGVVLTWISWLLNLFSDLTTNDAWINYYTTKAIKLWKLVTWATDLKIRKRKYHYEAHNNNYSILPLNVSNNGQRRWWLREVSVYKTILALKKWCLVWYGFKLSFAAIVCWFKMKESGENGEI